VVWVHGGGWRGGDKANPPAIFLVGRGYAVASINYRLSKEPKACFPAQIHDCKAAVRWLRAHAKRFNLDSQRIGAWGSSAGGHLVALLGSSGGVKELEGNVGDHPKESSQVQAVCDWFGPTDLEQFAEFQASGPGRAPDLPMQIVSQLLGGPPVQTKKLAREANPITYITAKSPPFLIMHGDRDALVPLSQSQLLADAIKATGSSVDFRVIDGAEHDIRGLTNIRAVEAFFNEHLGMKENGDGAKAQKKARLVATYAHKAGEAAPGNIKFFSNGYLESPDGPHTWVNWKNTLLLYWYSDNAPGGMWIDSCIFSADGSYRGKNQNGASIVGVKVKRPK
jgi:acetyl esterase/lipase